jgi:hypothetical protein
MINSARGAAQVFFSGLSTISSPVVSRVARGVLIVGMEIAFARALFSVSGSGTTIAGSLVLARFLMFRFSSPHAPIGMCYVRIQSTSTRSFDLLVSLF